MNSLTNLNSNSLLKRIPVAKLSEGITALFFTITVEGGESKEYSDLDELKVDYLDKITMPDGSMKITVVMSRRFICDEIGAFPETFRTEFRNIHRYLLKQRQLMLAHLFSIVAYQDKIVNPIPSESFFSRPKSRGVFVPTRGLTGEMAHMPFADTSSYYNDYETGRMHINEITSHAAVWTVPPNSDIKTIGLAIRTSIELANMAMECAYNKVYGGKPVKSCLTFRNSTAIDKYLYGAVMQMFKDGVDIMPIKIEKGVPWWNNRSHLNKMIQESEVFGVKENNIWQGDFCMQMQVARKSDGTFSKYIVPVDNKRFRAEPDILKQSEVIDYINDKTPNTDAFILDKSWQNGLSKGLVRELKNLMLERCVREFGENFVSDDFTSEKKTPLFVREAALKMGIIPNNS